MRRVLCIPLLGVVALFTATLQLKAQAPDASASTFLASALKQMQTGSVQDVKITATVRRIAGLTNESDPSTLEALSSGSTQTTLQTTAGPLVETRSWSAHGVRTGSWVDPQGKAHMIAYHNMMADPSWFFPLMTVARALDPSSGLTVTYIGTELFHGVSVQHIRLATAGLTDTQLQSVTQTDLYLDTSTFLPVGLAYNDHPDATVLVNIPVEVRFSNYQTVSGFTVPMKVQQFRNHALALDVQVQTAAFNTGLTIPAAAE